MEYIVATENMIDEVVQMRLEYVKAELGSLTEGEALHMKKNLPEYYKKHLNKDYLAFFAMDGKSVAGCACLHIIARPCRPQYKNGLIGEVLNVVTLEPYKHQGVASELMKMLMEEGKRRNLDFLFLEATEEGAPLYEKLGWERSAAYTPMQYLYR